MPASEVDAAQEPTATTATVESTGRLSSPVRPRSRIVTIDILRGFAILGILLVNMELFNQSVLNLVAELDKPATALDQMARWFIAFFAEGKFYSTFSFLFGLGMAIQFGRAEERNAGFGRFWIRRMLVLLLFGIWFVIMLMVPLLLNGALTGLVKMGEMTMGEQEMAQMFDEQIAGYAAAGQRADRIYATGSFSEVTAQRVRDMRFMYSVWPFMGFNVFAMMILGLYVGKRRIFDDVPGHLPLIRKVWLWGLVIGLIGNGMYVYFGEQATRTIPSIANLLSLFGQTIGAPGLALFFMATLTLLAERADWRRRLMPLAYVGRMALTNYLLQSVICSILFFGYGFGLYGKVGIAGGLLLTIVIFGFEVVFSTWWLGRFRFGPLEWLWRTLTYGKRQPIRRAAAS
jgi:uncharacterized protein